MLGSRPPAKSTPASRNRLVHWLLLASTLGLASCDLPFDEGNPDPDFVPDGCVDYRALLRVEGMVSPRKEIFSGVYDLVVVGDYCYAAYNNQIVVYDLSGSQLPSPVGSVNAPTYRLAAANHILVSGEYRRFSTIDISVPARPVRLGTIDMPVPFREIATDGDFAYFAAEEYGLWVVDIRDPSHPRLIGSIDTPARAVDVAVSNGKVYVADQNSLQIIDVSNPASPTYLASVEVSAQSVTLVGSYAVVCNGRLTVINISNPAAPRILGEYAPPGSVVYDVLIAGSRAYLLGSDLVVADLTSLLSPRITGRLPLSYRSDYSVGAHRDRVLLGSHDGLLVVDASNPRSARPIGTTNLQRSAERVAAHGDRVCVTAGESMWILDASSQNPVVTGRVILETAAHDVAMDSSIAYLASSEGLTVVNIDPQFPPRVIGRQSLPGRGQAIALGDHLAYLIRPEAGLWIVNVADPKQPRVVGSIYLPYATDVAVGKGWAFVTSYETGLVVIDVTNPRSPRIASQSPFRGAYGVCLQPNDLLHVVGENDSTAIYDVSQPAAPRRIAGLSLGPARDIVADERFAYLASLWGTQVIDMQVPTSPVLVGTVGQTVAWGLALDESRLFIAGGNLDVMSLQCDISSRAGGLR